MIFLTIILQSKIKPYKPQFDTVCFFITYLTNTGTTRLHYCRDSFAGCQRKADDLAASVDSIDQQSAWPGRRTQPVRELECMFTRYLSLPHACMSLCVQLELLRYRTACQASADTAKADKEQHVKPRRTLPRRDKIQNSMPAGSWARAKMCIFGQARGSCWALLGCVCGPEVK